MSVNTTLNTHEHEEEEPEKIVDELSPSDLKTAYKELLKREAALQQESVNQQQLLEKYRSIIEHSPNALFLTTSEGVILEANKSATDIFGHALEDLKRIGRQGIIDHTEPGIHAHLETRAQYGKVLGEVIGMHKNGERFPCMFISFIIPISNQEKQLTTIVEEIYEKKVTAQDLANTEKRFQQLIENGDDVIIEIDKQRIIKYVSPSVKRILGYDLDELLGHRLRELAYHEDAKLLASVFEEVLKNPGKTFHRQYRLKHKTKDFIWVQGSAISLYNISGIESLIINQRDISVEKNALELIMQSEKRYRYLFNRNPLPLFIFDLNTNHILECNEACLRQYGYNREEFLRLTVKDLRKEEDADVQLKEFDIRGNYLSQYKKTWKHRKKNGQLMYVKITASKINYREKDTALVLVNDITENVTAHNLLRESYDRLETAEQIAHLGYWEYDLATEKIYWSKEVFKIFGLSKAAFKSEFDSFLLRVHPADQAGLREALAEAIKNRKELIFEHRIVRADGAIRTVLEKGGFTFDAKKIPLKFQGTVQDITDQKMHELEREQLIRELTITVKDLQQFSYITSHNLRTPLSNLIGLLNLLEDIQIEDEMLAQIISGFKASTQALNETVDDLVKVLFVKKNASIEQEQLMLEPLFEKVIMQTKNLIEDTKANIHYDFSQVPLITFSKAYLESILLNLLTNALKYRSPGRELKISVTTEYINNKILLKFSDNGLGLDVERHRSRIFGFYQRFHDHPDSKGIGLYLVKSQLEASGGSIEIQSQVDVGTLFTLTFKSIQGTSS